MYNETNYMASVGSVCLFYCSFNWLHALWLFLAPLKRKVCKMAEGIFLLF